MEDVDIRVRAQAIGLTSRFAPAAIVDHPPRREPWGMRWGAAHRAELTFAAIHRRPVSLARTLFNTARARARAVARSPLSTDGISATASAVVELAHTALCWPAWKSEARVIAATPR
jgi:hypothetical protein